MEDLVLLDDKLMDETGVNIEVFDTEDGIEVVVQGRSGELESPFTLADLDSLLEDLQTGASVEDLRE